MQTLMELLLTLSKETCNPVSDLMKMEFHYVMGLYNEYVREQKEQDKAYKENNASAAQNYNMPNIPNMSNITSNMPKMNFNNGSLTIPGMPQMPPIHI